MSSRAKLWLAPALLYALFVFWYTDFGGPLQSEEIAQFKEKMTARGADAQAIAGIERFMNSDTGRQFIMINILDNADNPPDVEGAEPGESADQLMARYMAYMWPALLSRASHPVFMGVAVHTSIDVVGIENAENWDAGALMRYRSRRTLMEIVANAEQKDSHRFKIAALEKTIAFPVEVGLYLSDPRFLLALILVALTALVDNRLLSRRLKAV